MSERLFIVCSLLKMCCFALVNIGLNLLLGGQAASF